MEIIDLMMKVPPGFRIVVIVMPAVFAHFMVQSFKRLRRWMLTLKLGTGASTTVSFTCRHPKVDSVTSILVSGLTFAIYFMAIVFNLEGI